MAPFRGGFVVGAAPICGACPVSCYPSRRTTAGCPSGQWKRTVNPSRKLRRFESFTCHPVPKALTSGNAEPEGLSLTRRARYLPDTCQIIERGGPDLAGQPPRRPQRHAPGVPPPTAPQNEFACPWPGRTTQVASRHLADRPHQPLRHRRGHPNPYRRRDPPAPERHALVVAEHGKPIVAKLARCIDGRAGRRLLVTKPTPGRAWPPRSTTRFTPMRVPPLPWSKPAVARWPPTSQRCLMTAQPRQQPPAASLAQPFPQPGGSSSTPTGNLLWQPTAPRSSSAPSAIYATSPGHGTHPRARTPTAGSSCGCGSTKSLPGSTTSTSGTQPRTFPAAGPNTRTWFTTSRSSPTNAGERGGPLPATPSKTGTATGCQPSWSG